MTIELIEPMPQLDPRTIIATLERLARVEEQQRSTKDDLTAMRTTLHGINNEIQKLVVGEQTCANYLARIAEATKDLPAIATACAAFTEMRPELRAIIVDRERRQGLADFWKRFGIIMTGCAAMIAIVAGAGAGLVWLAQHLRGF